MRCRLCGDPSRATLSADVDLCGRCAGLVAREILGSNARFVQVATEARDPEMWLDLAVAYAEKGLGAEAREAAAQAIVTATDDAVIIGALAAIAHSTEARALAALLKRAQRQARRAPS